MDWINEVKVEEGEEEDIMDEEDVLRDKLLKELKPLIGEMVISFNSLEDNVFTFISELINDDLDVAKEEAFIAVEKFIK